MPAVGNGAANELCKGTTKAVPLPGVGRLPVPAVPRGGNSGTVLIEIPPEGKPVFSGTCGMETDRVSVGREADATSASEVEATVVEATGDPGRRVTTLVEDTVTSGSATCLTTTFAVTSASASRA